MVCYLVEALVTDKAGLPSSYVEKLGRVQARHCISGDP